MLKTVQVRGRAAGRIRPLSLSVLAVVAAGFLLCWPSLAWLASTWLDGPTLLNHGYLVAALSAALIVRSALALEPSDAAPNWWALGMLLALSFGWLLAVVGEVVAVHTALLPLVVLAGVYAAFGRKVAAQLAFPVLYLGVALPFWEDAQAWFQPLTTRVADALLGGLGVPVLIEGDLVHVAAGTFRIAYGCSGVNFIVVSLALGTLYGYLFLESSAARWKLAAAALATALLANWIRVVSIIYIGNASRMQSPLVDDHILFGWLLFALALLPLLGYARRLGNADVPARAAAVPAPDSAAGRPVLVSAMVVTLCLAIAPIWARAVDARYAEGSEADVELPAGTSTWRGPLADGPDWRPRFAGASGEALGRYVSDAGQVWMYSNVYLSQDQGRELINFDNAMAGDMAVNGESLDALFPDRGERWPVRRIEAAVDGRQWLIWYWYQLGDGREVSDVRAKIRQALAALSGHPEAGTTAIATTCAGACKSAADRLRRFAAEVGTDATWRALNGADGTR